MSNSLEPTEFKDGDTFSMERNDGFHDEGETIFDLDEFDRDLIEEAESAEEAV
jgi:flavin-dependent dehydrogenase